MRIGIDCRLGGITHAGIGRYVKELVARLVTKKTAHTWVLFFVSKKQAEEALGDQLKNKQVEIIIADIPHYSLKEQLQLPSIFSSASLDLLHVPHFNAPIFYFGKTVITIHDLLWHEQRGTDVTTLNKYLYWIKYLFYRVVTSISILKASAIFVPAETTKKIITRYYPFSKQKVTVTYEATSLPESKGSLPKNLRKKRYILYVGSLYPHKNISVVLEALKDLPAYNLVLVGSRSIFLEKIEQKIKEYKLSDQVKVLGKVSDEELVTIYQHAFALVQPSFSEGFGLTGIEAMQSGTVVLASNIPIFKEIYGEAAQYFNPHVAQSFKTAVHTLTASRRKTLLKNSKQQLKKFSWDAMTKQTLKIYQDA